MLFAQFANILFFWLATVHCCVSSQQTVSPSDDVLKDVYLNFSVHHKNGKEHSGWVKCELLNEDTPTSLPFANVEIVENNTRIGCRWWHSEANYDTVRYKGLCRAEFVIDLGRNNVKILSITKRIGSESKNLVVKLSRNRLLEDTLRAFDTKNVDVTQRPHSVKLPSRGEWYVYTQAGVRDSDLLGMSSTQLDKTYGEVKDWCGSSEDKRELPPPKPPRFKRHYWRRGIDPIQKNPAELVVSMAAEYDREKRQPVRHDDPKDFRANWVNMGSRKDNKSSPAMARMQSLRQPNGRRDPPKCRIS